MVRRERVEPTDDWDQLVLLFKWPEQEEYELIRQPVLFGTSVAERARETGTPERTLYWKIEQFANAGIRGLFSTEEAKREVLPRTIRRMIVDLKAEHPALNNNEIRNIVYVRTGRRLGDHTVARVLAEEVVPLKLSRLFDPYHEIEDSGEKRSAVVALHLDGWSVKATASYMKISKKTVYRIIERWLEYGDDGLEDRPPGRPKGAQKVDLATMNFIRKMQQNPELGAFRIHAALEQKRGTEISARTVGRIMAVHRNTYGLDKPKRSPHKKRQMPFEAASRHQIWTADVRYIKKHQLPVAGYLYVISILENYSRKILASAVCPRQNLASFLPVLYSAIESYGPPETFVTDSGSIFLANQAQQVYEALNIDKVEIEKGQPWQSYIETNFNTQRKMLDYHAARAQSWDEIVAAHDTWMADYNAQRHFAHEHREDGRRSPDAVLGFYIKPRYQSADLRRIFYEECFERVLDALGRVRIMHWLLLGNEVFARREVELWISPDALTVEHGGETLSRYEVEYRPANAGAAGELRRVRCLELFETADPLPQPRLFGLEEALGEGWLKALRLDGYAPRSAPGPRITQETLFPHWLGLSG